MAHPFGMLLKYAWDRYPELQDVHAIIPVPLFRRNERVRGYNQADLLAEDLARVIQRPFFPALLRTRHTRSQYTLNRTERQLNVQSAFQLHPYVQSRAAGAIARRSFLLIDDICTTVSTLEACAGVLQRAGAVNVKALVLSRDL